MVHDTCWSLGCADTQCFKPYLELGSFRGITRAKRNPTGCLFVLTIDQYGLHDIYLRGQACHCVCHIGKGNSKKKKEQTLMEI